MCQLTGCNDDQVCFQLALIVRRGVAAILAIMCSIIHVPFFSNLFYSYYRGVLYIVHYTVVPIVEVFQ